MTNDQIQSILQQSRTIAVYGMSRNPAKAAHRVPARMADLGFEIVPVNPFVESILGRRCYTSLLDVPDPIDVVNVFRPSADALAVVEEALARHQARGDVRLIWLQSGIVNETARQLAEDAGVPFLQNRCMAVVVPELFPRGLDT